MRHEENPPCVIAAMLLAEKVLNVNRMDMLEFFHDAVHDDPSTLVIANEKDGKYIITAMMYSDDQEFIDQTITKIQDLFKTEMDQRYPSLLEEVEVIDHRKNK